MAGKKKKSKLVLLAGAILLLGAVITSYVFYQKIFVPNVSIAGPSPYFYIPTGSTFEDVVKALDSNKLLKNEASFRWLAEKMNYTSAVKPGKYQLRSGMSNKELVTLLRSGRQVPVKLTFNNIRLRQELADRIAAQIEAPAQSLLNLMGDPDYVAGLGFTTDNILCMFIPNTYELYWNTSADQFLRRMKKEYDKFWNENRLAQARNLGYTPIQVSILAAIVQKETNANDEKNIIAGVYINRLKKGWKLEADPTLVYALGDFTVTRVLAAFKQVVSPYNTYMYEGLPPGPICLPDISSLDAVLHYAQHNYMYFCAREDFSGRHSFAVTYTQHMENARRFQRALDKRGIRS